MMAFIGVLFALAAVIGLSVYDLLAWSYVASIVWGWTIGHELGVQLSYEFFVGAVFILRVAKYGLATSSDSKEGKQLWGVFAAHVVMPWAMLLVVWVALS